MNSILFLFFISWVNRKWTIKIFGKFKKVENFKPGFLWWVSDHYWWRHLWSVSLGKRITETIIWIVFEVFFHFHNSLRLFWMISHKIWVLIKYKRFVREISAEQDHFGPLINSSPNNEFDFMISGYWIGMGDHYGSLLLLFIRNSRIMEFPLIEMTVDLYEGILITTSFACWVLIVSPSQSKKVLSISNFP